MMNRATTLPITVGRKPPEWREKIREATRVMVDSLIDRDGAADTEAIREEVVLAARVALGEAESGPLVGAMLENAEAIDDGAGFEDSSMAGMLRYVLDTFHRGWDTPTQHESIMAEVQGVLEDMLGARAKLDDLGRLLATIVHQLADPAARPDRGELMARVSGHLDTAFGDAPSDAMFKRMTITRDDGTVAEEEMATPPGLVRMVVAGFDVTDAEVVTTIRDVIERSARAELAREVPGAPA